MDKKRTNLEVFVKKQPNQQSTTIKKPTSLHERNSKVNNDHDPPVPPSRVWMQLWTMPAMENPMGQGIRSLLSHRHLIRDGKSLLHIYERLSAEHPDVLQTHYKFIEEQYIEHKQKPPPPPPPPPKTCINLKTSKKPPPQTPIPRTPSPLSSCSLPPPTP